MKRWQRISFLVAGALVVAVGLGVAPSTKNRRVFPTAGATLDEIRAFADAEQAAAKRRRLPPFKEVHYSVTATRITMTTEWFVRRGHSFASRSVDFPFHYVFQKTGPNSFRLLPGPQTFTGTNTSRWKWKWDL